MAITTYAELQTAVANWLNDSTLTARIVEFIALAESEMNARLRAQNVQVDTTLTVTGGTPTVSLPADHIETIVLYRDGSPPVQLTNVAPSAFFLMENVNESGLPERYTHLGAGKIRVTPIPAANTNLKHTYYAASLNIASAANWVLTRHPGAYLFGALKEAEPYLVNDARVALWQSKYEEAMSRIEMEAEASKYGGGPLVATPSGPTV